MEYQDRFIDSGVSKVPFIKIVTEIIPFIKLAMKIINKHYVRLY